VLKTCCEISTLAGVAAETVLALATGNNARVYGLNTGLIAEGRDADLLVLDAPWGSAAGDALGAIAIGDIGRVHDGATEQALGIDQQMALAAVDFLAPIIAPGAAHGGRFDRWAVDDRRPRLRVTARLDPGADTECRVQPLPQALQAPEPAVMGDRWPRRHVVGHQPPRTPAPQPIENGMQDLSARMAPRPPTALGGWQMGLQTAPFGINQVS
jgi:hypothetical protein